MAGCDQCKKGNAKIHLKMDEGVPNLVLCSDCYNEVMAEELGVSYEELLIKSFEMEDSLGEVHQFDVDQRVFPNGTFLEARERKEHGYFFAIYDEIGVSAAELLQKLMEKVKSGLSQKYIEENDLGGVSQPVLAGDEVWGRIEYDEKGNGVPLVVVDGKPYKWSEFGKLISANEGFQFVLKIHEFTD
ncbi:hypothetical protein FZC78_07690 [Rossellomorea vietnamensis]|uniref:Uncharacterized protein n=1 Tax=Rossellomorea vietnamensis TaxID=218284 RepID=A0A5D4NTT3_9BACI|nr:hypothetical protein [Rossellomorea vietnamensis]TYS17733.1 hypothetical protein FZC78_07690 [Rossellomorea vietnamensis]